MPINFRAGNGFDIARPQCSCVSPEHAMKLDDAFELDDDSFVLDDDASVIDDEAVVLDDDAVVLDDDALVLADDALVVDDDAVSQIMEKSVAPGAGAPKSGTRARLTIPPPPPPARRSSLPPPLPSAAAKQASGDLRPVEQPSPPALDPSGTQSAPVTARESAPATAPQSAPSIERQSEQPAAGESAPVSDRHSAPAITDLSATATGTASESAITTDRESAPPVERQSAPSVARRSTPPVERRSALPINHRRPRNEREVATPSDRGLVASVRVGRGGAVLASSGAAELLAQLVAYVSGLIPLLRRDLGLDPFDALCAELVGRRVLVFREGDQLRGLMFEPSADVQRLRQRLGV